MQIDNNASCRIYIDNVFYDNESVYSSLTEDKPHTVKIKNNAGETTSEETLIIKTTSPIATKSFHFADSTLEKINSDKTFWR